MRDTDEPSTGLTLCTDLAATDWLVDQDLPWYQLAGRGPIGFPKYARLRFIPDPSFPDQKSNDVDFDQTGPEEKVLIGFALDVLSSYTTTPDECYFCMWTGWGSAVGDDVPRFEIPNRDYWLFRGTLADYADWSVENSVRWPWGSSPDPAFIWPADHAWCITNDVDPHFAIIAAPDEAIIRIVADSRIDAVLDDPDIVPPYWH